MREAKGTGTLVPRTDLFGFGNYTGLAAVIVAVMLLALSNDCFLRRLGAPRWKQLERWNYALFALVIAHGVAYQVIEKRNAPFVILFSLFTAFSIVIQLLGYRRVRSVTRSALSFHSE